MRRTAGAGGLRHHGRGRQLSPRAGCDTALDETTPPGSCNAGFLRDDAILVVTIITDEDDYASDGTLGDTAEWMDDLVAAKNGDPSAVVVLGLLGNEEIDCGENSTRLGDFVSLWADQGRAGSICADSYVPLFEEVVGLIDGTCDDFVPPG